MDRPCFVHGLYSPNIGDGHLQWHMQDEHVACRDLGKELFERAVSCFGTSQLERATRVPMPQLERATPFSSVQ